MSNIWLIVAREFNERVRKKSFIVTTLLMPVLMLGLMLAPALMMRYASGQTKTIVVIDRSGLVAQHLESSDEVETSDLPVDTARRVMIDKFGVLCIGADVLANPSDVKLYANSASSMMLEENLRGQIAKVLEREKLRAYRIEDLDRILADVKMQVARNDEGSPSSGSSAVAAMVGLGLGMVLYMFLMIYGAMVMQSVIEEKSSRVLEVVVSSVRPFELMMGKIFGVASVAVVQVLIWAVLVCGAGAAVMPHVLPDGAMEAAAALQQGGGAATAAAGDFDPETLGAIALATDVSYLAMLFGYLLLFVVGGYLLYSAMFAAVGSAVDNAQDAAQLQTPIMIPIILAVIVEMSVLNDPNSPLAFWFSLIPFTSPVVMMARIPYGIPTWEIVLSLVLLYAAFVGMVWLSAKIYRVGIFMYGKKPTLREMFRWIRYKY
mgnify:CR=1 FL=1